MSTSTFIISRTPTVGTSQLANADFDSSYPCGAASNPQPNFDAPSQENDISNPRNSLYRNSVSRIFSVVHRRHSQQDLRSQLKVFSSPPALLFISAIVILLNGTLLNVFKCDPQQLINNGFTNPDLHRSLPAVIWYVFMSSAVLFGVGACQTLLTFSYVLVRPEIALTRRQYVGVSLTTFATGYGVGLMMINYIQDVRIAANLCVSTGSCVSIALLIHRNCRQHGYSAYAQRVGKWVILLGLNGSVGFGSTVVLMRYGFPAVQHSLEALPEGNFYSVIRSGAEILFLYFFFSIWRPIWIKGVAYSGEHVATCYNDDMAKDENMFNQMRFVMNFIGDLLYLVFGRGLFIDMSGTLGFILVFVIAGKDSISRIWNFGFKYMDECIIFSIKMFHPIESQRLGRKWKFVADTVDGFLRLYSLPRQLAAVWYLTIDYRKVDPLKYVETDGHIEYEEPTTRISVSIKIMDYMVNIDNIPLHFDKPPLDAIDKSNPRASKYTSNVAVADSSSVIMSRVFPYFPVFEAEKTNLRWVCGEMQSIIFQRYQNLALAKVFTTFLFLAAPTVAALTDTRYIPGFRDPWDDTAAAHKYLACGIFFMVTDIMEWCIVMFGFYYRYEGFHEQVYRYLLLFAKNKWVMRTFSVVATFFGMLWFHLAWDPYSEVVFLKKFPEVDLDDILAVCNPFFLN